MEKSQNSQNDYRDCHGSAADIDICLKAIKASDMSERQKIKIEDFCRLLALGKLGKRVKYRKIIYYLQFLRKLHNYFKKDLDKITEKEAEKFYEDLQTNKIRKNNNMPFSDESKNAFVVTLKRYIGFVWNCWNDHQNVKYRKVFGWMKENCAKSNKRAITKQEAEKIIEAEPNERNRCLFMFLFDSGARIEEALNVRFCDISKNEKNNIHYFKVHLRGRKTEDSDRVISIALVTKQLNDWIQNHPSQSENDYIFPIQYDNARKIIGIMSKRIISYKLKPHELRHSSATHYIQYGGFGAENIGGFYYRYGWKFGSKEARTYIKTYLYGGEAGQNKVVKAITHDAINDLKNVLDEKSFEIEELKKQITKQKELTAENIKNQLSPIIAQFEARQRELSNPEFWANMLNAFQKGDKEYAIKAMKKIQSPISAL